MGQGGSERGQGRLAATMRRGHGPGGWRPILRRWERGDGGGGERGFSQFPLEIFGRIFGMILWEILWGTLGQCWGDFCDDFDEDILWIFRRFFLAQATHTQTIKQSSF